MALTQYTSFDDIRAALGVSEDEIDDATLSLPLYEYNLLSELSKVSPQVTTTLAALPSDSLSASQEQFKRAAFMFSTYAVATQLCSTLPLFSPKEISDGKAHITRYAQDPYKATIDAVKSLYETYRKDLIETLSDLLTLGTDTSLKFRRYVSNVPRTTDPVTGA